MLLKLHQRRYHHVRIDNMTVLVILQQTCIAASGNTSVYVVGPVAHHQHPLHILHAAQGSNVEQAVRMRFRSPGKVAGNS